MPCDKALAKAAGENILVKNNNDISSYLDGIETWEISKTNIKRPIIVYVCAYSVDVTYQFDGQSQGLYTR